MPEALTESFCERCGTRYEFKAPTRLNPLRKTRGVVSGLKNYIMSQDALGDALGDAMRSEQDSLAAAQLEAFHTSFNFCIDCRQYTCLNCWNDDAGRCRSCAPVAGTDDLAERLEAGLTLSASALATNGSAPPAEMGRAEIDRRLGVEAWPTADLDELRADATPSSPEPIAAAEAEVEPPTVEPEPISQPFVLAEAEPEPEPVVRAEAEPEPLVRAEVELEPEPVEQFLAARHEAERAPEPEPLDTTAPQPVLGWDADDSFELIQFPTPAVEEPASIEFAAAPELVTEEPAWTYEDDEPVVESTVPLSWAEAPDFSLSENDIVSRPEPEPTPQIEAPAARDEPPVVREEPPVVREEPPAPVPHAVPPLPPVTAAPPTPKRRRATSDDRVAASAETPAPPEVTDPVLAARRAQLDMLGLGDPGSGVLSDQTRPLPYRSSGASVHPAELAARLAAEQQGIGSPAQTIRASMWDASAREVAGAPSQVGVQSCGGCGLSLSATARFCRRCGTRQAQPA